MRSKWLILGGVLVVALVLLAACANNPTPTPVPDAPQAQATPEACPTCPPQAECPEAAPCPTPVAEVPFQDLWVDSPHNDITAEAFTHWNEEDPAEVPETCAKCHSSLGYQDFLGVDGTAAGVVDSPHPVGTTVDCVACHNTGTITKTTVIFPSGLEVTNLGDESRCMECHQGRESKVSVDAAIEKAGVADEPDTISPDLGFRNIHYFAAAATQFGTQAKGGYEYDGKSYDIKFAHVEGLDTCKSCHNPHTLEVNVETCTTCHEGVTTVEDLFDVRMAGSEMDYDGDGNVEEGILAEVQGVQEVLYETIISYTKELTGTPIVYSPTAYPYFFYDTNGDGEAGEDEAVGDNRFAAWTPRLLRAAYNYQVANKDPGKFAHNSKYIIQLMYDSIEDVNSALETPGDISMLTRNDAGHFAGSTEPFRHWDEEGAVPANCAKCHSAGGLPQLISEGVVSQQPVANGFACTTCHANLDDFARYEIESVTFPSGAVLSFEEGDNNLCLSCHQGRESTVSVNRLIGDLGDDETSDRLRFLNVHYFAAGASLFGTQAKGAYEFEGKTYNGANAHVPGFNTCAGCHDVHSQEVKTDLCSTCHAGITDVRDIRGPTSTADYDGDGDTTEGINGEIDTVREKLLAAMQAYATATAGSAIAYDPAAYPYFFIDGNGNGTVDPDEANSDNRFVAWTPTLLRAAYNYQYAGKDPGAFAHNGKYILQTLYDSIAAAGGDTAGLTRP